MKKAVSIIALLLATATAAAQIDDGWLDQSDFDTFRQQAEKRYNDFLDSANAQFARALAGEWHPFEVSAPIDNPHKPQPKTPPVAPKPQRATTPVPQKLPGANVLPPDLPAPPRPREMTPPTPPSDVMRASVPFYNAMLSLEVPGNHALSQCRLTGIDEAAVSRFWEALARVDMQGTIGQLLEQQRRYRLNDWGLYDMTLRLAQSLFPGDDNSQVVLTVFLLNQMEYNARIARTEKGLACLMAIKGDIYAVPFITIGDIRYYIFMPHSRRLPVEGSLFTYTASMDAATHYVDVKLHEFPQLPRLAAGKKYSRTVADRTVEIVANASLMDFYSNYPQVEFAVYATAAVGDDFAAAVERNFRSFVTGKSPYAAVSVLLHFMHHGFDYATDQEQFGYEKPFFCEENFYYPKNDCEDRSILFSYLVRALLGLDVVLLEYSDHVATAVCFPNNDVGGDYYLINGKHYVVCDPTYIGASVGMAMPKYKTPNTEVKAIVL